jgi:hypothetical protein
MMAKKATKTQGRILFFDASLGGSGGIFETVCAGSSMMVGWIGKGIDGATSVGFSGSGIFNSFKNAKNFSTSSVLFSSRSFWTVFLKFYQMKNGFYCLYVLP